MTSASTATPAPSHGVKEARESLGECPVRSVAEQVLYWVDDKAPALNRFDPATGDNTALPTPAFAG